MVKMEAFDNSHFMHQQLEVVILITLVASFLQWHASILKRNFYVTGHSHVTVIALVW